MQASETCYAFIKKNEGFSIKAYWDKFGRVWTIGWGSIRHDDGSPIREGEVCTEAEAQHYLEREVHQVEAAVNAAIKVPLTQAEFDAIVDFGYNVGTGWITGKGHDQASFIKALNQGNYAGVPAGLQHFTRDTHGGLVQALVTRRKWEGQMWLAGEQDHSHIAAAAPQNQPGDMPQAVTPSVPQNQNGDMPMALSDIFSGLISGVASIVNNPILGSFGRKVGAAVATALIGKYGIDQHSIESIIGGIAAIWTVASSIKAHLPSGSSASSALSDAAAAAAHAAVTAAIPAILAQVAPAPAAPANPTPSA